MQRQRREERSKAHGFENCPPHQERYPRGGEGGDSDWNLMGTAGPIDSSKINTMANSGSVEVISHERTVMYPATNDLNSPNIFKSTTDGKGRR